MLATLFLSQGVPMLLGGDEIARTQGGNNNGYAQDNNVSWYDWANADTGLLAFVQQLIALRAKHPIFRRRRWFDGRPIHGADVHDLGWYRPDGSAMEDDDWEVGYARALALYLNGDAISSPGPQGEKIRDDHFLLLFNASPEPIHFALPDLVDPDDWSLVLDTAASSSHLSDLSATDWTAADGTAIEVAAWAVAVLTRPVGVADGLPTTTGTQPGS